MFEKKNFSQKKVNESHKSQDTFTCSMSTIETLEKGVKYVHCKQ